MVKELLTSEMIDVGENLLKSLDAMGLPITAAMWLFDAETNDWRLKFASPATSIIGRREVYGKVAEARNALGLSSDDFPLDTVGLFDSGDKLIGSLQKALKTGPGISRIRYSRNVVNGQFIHDALIYRLTQPAAPSPSN
jgi:hypothetical protein